MQLDIIKRLALGSVDVDQLWGCYGSRGRGLRFTESGYQRAAFIVGWIYGLWMSGQAQLAEELSGHFVKTMDQLATFGGTVQDRPEADPYTPYYLVRLSDDGSFGSFSVCWFAYVGRESGQEHQHIEKNRKIVDGFGHNRNIYGFSFNGGLIFHGHGGEKFSVRVGNSDNPWSVHT